MTEPNIPLLRKMVEWVEEQEQLPARDREWEQVSWLRRGTYWTCGTVMCVAGKVAVDAGFVPSFGNDDFTYYVTDPVTGQSHDVEKLAAELLGIGDDSPLFGGSNNAADIRRHAEAIAGERL
jgi:hypothetical protein